MTLSDLWGTLILFAYYMVSLVALPTALKAWTRTPHELIRKIQHVGYSLSIFIMVRLFSTWYSATLAALLLLVLAYPVLFVLEKTRWYKKLFVDRTSRGGELRKQLLYVQLSFALLVLVFWGLLGERWHFLIPVAVMAWGFGDAAAALIGKSWGKRHVIHRWIDKAKTWEGTGAMIGFAFAAVFLTMFLYGGQSWYVSLIVAAILAPASAFVELFSSRGLDTLTVPLATAMLALPVVALFHFLGW